MGNGDGDGDGGKAKCFCGFFLLVLFRKCAI